MPLLIVSKDIQVTYFYARNQSKERFSLLVTLIIHNISGTAKDILVYHHVYKWIVLVAIILKVG